MDPEMVSGDVSEAVDDLAKSPGAVLEREGDGERLTDGAGECDGLLVDPQGLIRLTQVPHRD